MWVIRVGERSLALRKMRSTTYTENEEVKFTSTGCPPISPSSGSKPARATIKASAAVNASSRRASAWPQLSPDSRLQVSPLKGCPTRLDVEADGLWSKTSRSGSRSTHSKCWAIVRDLPFCQRKLRGSPEIPFAELTSKNAKLGEIPFAAATDNHGVV
jgi:hypothetical protein